MSDTYFHEHNVDFTKLCLSSKKIALHLECFLINQWIMNFNQSVDKLPITLKRVRFGIDFNKSIDNLPMSVENIVFGNRFNRPLIKLPKNICKITCSFGT